MCAINGIFLRSLPTDPELGRNIQAMQKASSHRGPDQSVFRLFNRASLGTNRLAIVGLDDDAIGSDRSRSVILNGEIVNYRALAVQLGLSPRCSDTSIILPLIDRFGDSFVEKCAGMFSIAVYDFQKHELQLWRDPLGVKPLYFYQDKDRFILSSEIKAILKILPRTPELDMSAIDDILRYRFVGGRKTVFKTINKLLPGEKLVVNSKGITHTRYYKLPDNTSADHQDYSVEEFEKLFDQVVFENVSSDVKGGFFTSGGLDSSMVTACGLAHKGSYNTPISLKFYPNKVEDEEYAHILEKHLGTKFEWVFIDDEIARKTLEKIVPLLDEPLENPTHIGSYLMAKRARDLGIKSVLTGDGSDEFFLGYERHANWFNNTDPIANYPKLLWTMSDDDATSLYKKDVLKSLSPMKYTDNLKVSDIKNIKQALFFERTERLPEYHNMRLDRMTMANAVEARVPFLDRRIVDYSLKIPVDVHFKKTGKDWLQQVASKWVPEPIIKRKKILFPSLPDQWVGGEGTLWASDILLNPSSNIGQWFERSELERYLSDHFENRNKKGKLLWALIVLELWLQNIKQNN